ncbi:MULTISPECIES: hypothetical protein [Streptomyces]|uniref:hypothetical protein n=1 Tax=Streptomyces TaxID=1883 RepID=UPI00123D7134|nr:hypothetical protein [Streptomyces galilaeus]QEU65306.1 hypothetical protein CP966_08495 [Streptomyces galilaeus]GGW28820.1 hypothetical protein GCM10010350_10460 [Streptomyces galilaeus]
MGPARLLPVKRAAVDGGQERVVVPASLRPGGSGGKSVSGGGEPGRAGCVGISSSLLHWR